MELVPTCTGWRDGDRPTTHTTHQILGIPVQPWGGSRVRGRPGHQPSRLPLHAVLVLGRQQAPLAIPHPRASRAQPITPQSCSVTPGHAPVTLTSRPVIAEVLGLQDPVQLPDDLGLQGVGAGGLGPRSHFLWTKKKLSEKKKMEKH